MIVVHWDHSTVARSSPAFPVSKIAIMRLRSDIWVKAYVRRCATSGGMALIARSGDPERGAVFITVNRPGRKALVYGPAPAGLGEEDRRFATMLGDEPVDIGRVGEFLARQVSFDDDIWIIDVDDHDGRHFLDDELAA